MYDNGLESCVPDHCPECPENRGSTNAERFATFGVAYGDIKMGVDCDDCSVRFYISQSVFLMGNHHNEVYVESNGYLTFGGSYINSKPSLSFHSNEYRQQSYLI